MTDTERAGVAADEAAIEKQYNEALAERAKSLQRMTNLNTANTWTTSTKVDVPREGELIGRVALEGPTEILDGARDFYIGTAKHDGGDYQVYSWVAPIACTYYRKSSTHHDLCDDVIGVRVLARQGDRIVDFEDEPVGSASNKNLFPKRQLQVPRAPVPRVNPQVSPVAAPETVNPKPADDRHFENPTTTPPILLQKTLPTTGGSVATTTSRPVPGPDLRAPELLRRQLSAPKTVSMSTVLATLQSDQYDAITKPVSASQVLQGHPGTGKTIIAAHRAAYLLDSEAPPEARPNGHLLILGPTEEYVEHVRGALKKLIGDSESYEVRAIPTVLEDLAGLPHSTEPTQSYTWEDVSPELATLVNLAYTKAREQSDPGERPNSADVYAELIWLLQDPPPRGLQPEWVHYLRELPNTYQELKRRRISSYRGLMAYIGARTTQMRNPGHVIVDEAQDIHPIEWEILGRLGNRGGWTILGDLNQRRTDHTFGSWDEVASLLGIEGDDGRAPVQVLERGYRSTAQIIRFANQLLPSRERALFSLQQDGEVPTVQRAASAREIYELASDSATALLARVGVGTVALITTQPRSMSAVLTRRGWSAAFGDPFTWRSEDRVLKLLPPARARGLEFDGVVVVEPSDFPENFGRQGVLYTALTRANRFLTVVHYRALPRGMKARP